MLKMFTTQLQGLFKRIQEKEEMAMEDGARLLAQAAIGEGKIYIVGINEMKAVEIEALYGAEPFKGVYEWQGIESISTLTNADRVILISRFSHDEQACQIGQGLSDNNIPFVSISSEISSDQSSLVQLADVHIDLRLTKGLLPNNEGNRYGFPSSMAALFAYYALKYTLEEILEEYED
ncbi:DUF2529 domain-containing protein [Bacillus massilinigeriensis]|uniref:DUF2529 domain-containing protein n=1 Tax=Bacillus massilionigeriensis TaxID=1805475 RepID=UPI00096B242C|nr:DUF2529 domain-containing protein [Bacillus massilionigeriensis]